MLNTDYNIYNLIIHDFFWIPIQLRKENRFCLWKYVQSSNPRGKILKRPYGIDSTNSIIPSLKEKTYWLNLSQLDKLSLQIQQRYGLGLILNDSNYVVIDLDKCISIKNNNVIFSNQVKKILNLFADAYCEISPSNTGLHIIFEGQWLSSSNKAVKYIHENLSNGTIEIYSGNDCRYITLTGNSINKNYLQDNLSYYSFESTSLQKIYNEFFLVNRLNKLSKEFQKNVVNKKNFIQLNLSEKYLLTRKKILNSDLSLNYSHFCETDNPMNQYKSTSEADWYYLNLVLKFLAFNQSYEEKYFLLKYFYQTDRPERFKKYREDYIKITVDKILNSSFIGNNPIKINTSNQKINKQQIEKNYVLKICNTMKIFHLGKSIKNFEYINNKTDNYIKAIIPVSLNENDFVYYIEILDQYSNFISSKQKFSIDDYFPVNINKILANLNKTKSGRSHNEFINVVEKLSAVNIKYIKLISKKKLVYCKEGGSLLSYKYFYTGNSQIKSTKKYKKLYIRMHRLIYDLLKDSDYNYSIFNKKSFDTLIGNQLKLLYYYFCISTLPGCFSKNFSIDSLLQLWPNSYNRQTILKRKKILYNLLLEFEKYKEKILDLDLILEIEENEIVGVNIRKKKLDII